MSDLISITKIILLNAKLPSFIITQTKLLENPPDDYLPALILQTMNYFCSRQALFKVLTGLFASLTYKMYVCSTFIIF